MLSNLMNTSIVGMQKSIERYESIIKRSEDSDLIRDMVEMLEVSSEFKANTKAIKVADEMLGTVIDILA